MSHGSASHQHATEPAPLVMDRDAVARALGISESRFRNIRRELEARGFPPALPVLTGKWSRLAVVTWIEQNGQPKPLTIRPIEEDGATHRAIEDLERRYGWGRK